jgi:hypothetical protein
MEKPNKKRNPFAKQLRHWRYKIIKSKKKYQRKNRDNSIELS